MLSLRKWPILHPNPRHAAGCAKEGWRTPPSRTRPGRTLLTQARLPAPERAAFAQCLGRVCTLMARPRSLDDREISEAKRDVGRIRAAGRKLEHDVGLRAATDGEFVPMFSAAFEPRVEPVTDAGGVRRHHEVKALAMFTGLPPRMLVHAPAPGCAVDAATSMVRSLLPSFRACSTISHPRTVRGAGEIGGLPDCARTECGTTHVAISSAVRMRDDIRSPEEKVGGRRLARCSHRHLILA